MTISRRSLTAAFLSASVGLRLATTGASAQLGTQPKIGDPKFAFDTWFGSGTPVDDYIHYPPLSAGRASYFVMLNDSDRAEAIVGNFHDLDGGGISHSYENVHEIGQSQFVPDGAGVGPLARFGILLHQQGSFGVRAWASPGVSNQQYSSGQVIVMDRLVMGEMMGMQLFKETIVVTDSAARYPIVPTDMHLGPHSSDEDWRQYPGGVSMHQSGLDLQSPPVPGNWSVYGNTSGISVTFEDPQPIGEVADLIGSMLPLGELEWSAWIPRTPITPWQIRLHHFRAHDSGAQYLSAQFIDGDQDTGTVTRFALTASVAT